MSSRRPKRPRTNSQGSATPQWSQANVLNLMPGTMGMATTPMMIPGVPGVPPGAQGAPVGGGAYLYDCIRVLPINSSYPTYYYLRMGGKGLHGGTFEGGGELFGSTSQGCVGGGAADSEGDSSSALNDSRSSGPQPSLAALPGR